MAFRPMRPTGTPTPQQGMIPAATPVPSLTSPHQQQPLLQPQSQQLQRNPNQAPEQADMWSQGNPMLGQLKSVGQKAGTSALKQQFNIGGSDLGYNPVMDKLGFAQLGGTNPASIAQTAGFLVNTPGTGLSMTGAGSQAAMLAEQTAGLGSTGAQLTAESLGGAAATTSSGLMNAAAAAGGTAIMGAAVTMWMQAFISDQFGKSAPRFNFVTSGGATQGVKDNYSVESPFGYIGYGSESKKIDANDKDNQQVLQVMGKVDEAIASTMTPDQVNTVKETLIGYGDQNGRHDVGNADPEQAFADLMRRRYRDVFVASGNDEMVEKLDSIGAYVKLDSQNVRHTPWDKAHNPVSFDSEWASTEVADVDRRFQSEEDFISDIEDDYDPYSTAPDRAKFNEADIAAFEAEEAKTAAKYNWHLGAPGVQTVLETITTGMQGQQAQQAQQTQQAPQPEPQQPQGVAWNPGPTQSMARLSSMPVTTGGTGILPMQRRNI